MIFGYIKLDLLKYLYSIELFDKCEVLKYAPPKCICIL